MRFLWWNEAAARFLLIYLAISLSYQGRSDAIPVVQNTTGFEYDLTKKIKKLIDSDLSSIAIAQFSASNQSNEGIKQILSESYQITTIPLSSAVPADVGVMIINGVSDINRVVYDITSKPPSTIELE